MPLSVSALLAGGALSGGFGQFASGHDHQLMVFDVGPTSFRARSPQGIELILGNERSSLSAPRLSRYEKMLSIRPSPGSPIRIHYETTSLGFSLEYLNGMRLSAKGVGPPYISCEGSSVGPGVPSAPSRWALLSWPEPRPPILLCFPSGPVGLTARQTDDGFVIEAGERFAGWVRVRAPFGGEAIATTSVAELGELLKLLTPVVETLIEPAPKLVAASVREDARGLTATWRFDRPGSMVPPPLIAQRALGSVRILSPIRKAAACRSADLWECEGLEMKVRFLASALKPGAAIVALRPIREGLPATISHIDAESVADGAAAWLSGNADGLLVDALKASVGTFAAEGRDREPVTGAEIAFERSGRGTRLAAAHALAQEAFSQHGGPLGGLLAGIDWVTWLPPGGDERERIDAAALVSVAAALRASPEERVLGAMANLGAMSAGGGEKPAPFEALRSWLYPHLNWLEIAQPDWLAALRSPVRIITTGVQGYVDASAIVLEGSARGTATFQVVLRSSDLLHVTRKQNLSRADVVLAETSSILWLTPERAGAWQLRLSRRAGASPLPRAAPGPRYSGDRR